MPTYPFWDTSNRYIVSGPTGKTTVFAQIFQLPNAFWQVRCYGNRSDCPEKLGPFFGPITNAQAAIQAHCQSVHYIVPPPPAADAPALAVAASSAPDPCTPSKIIPRF